MLNLAESPMRRWHEEAQSIAQLVSDDGDGGTDLRDEFLDLSVQLVVEQPLKTPFVAAVVLLANATRSEIAADVLGRVAPRLQVAVERGEWRDVKLYLKFLACLQSCLAGGGVFPILEVLFNRAVDLQTEDSADVSLAPVASLAFSRLPLTVQC